MHSLPGITTPKEYGFEHVVEEMTNHERNRWARAGYPGAKERDETQAIIFLGPRAAERLEARVARHKARHAELLAMRRYRRRR